MEQPSLLSHLIVTEMIRELSKKYENFHNKREIVEQNIYLFGKKPGFAMTSQLIRKNNSDKRGIHEVAEFMAKTLTPAIFGIPSITAGFKINENRLSIGFQHKIPKPFSFLPIFKLMKKKHLLLLLLLVLLRRLRRLTSTLWV